MNNEEIKSMASVGLSEAIVNGGKNLFNFNGKAGRSEFWWCALAWLVCLPIITFAVMFLSLFVCGVFIFPNNVEYTRIVTSVIEILALICWLVVLLALMYRRFHDVGADMRWAVATICLLPFAICGIFFIWVLWKTNAEISSWSIGEVQDYWLLLVFMIVSIVSLIAFIPISIKTLKVLLKK